MYFLPAITLSCSGAEADAPGVYDGAGAGCGVVACPAGVEYCCTEVVAIASDNQAGGYERRRDLVQEFVESSSEVRADFGFGAEGQQGSIVFNLGRQRALYGLSVLLASSEASSSVVVTFVDAANAGCVSSLEGAFSGAGSSAMAYDVDLLDDGNCFLQGTPGEGSVLEFGIISDAPGGASLSIRHIELRGD